MESPKSKSKKRSRSLSAKGEKGAGPRTKKAKLAPAAVDTTATAPATVESLRADVVAIQLQLQQQKESMEAMVVENKKLMDEQKAYVKEQTKKMMKALKMTLEFSAQVKEEAAAAQAENTSSKRSRKDQGESDSESESDGESSDDGSSDGKGGEDEAGLSDKDKALIQKRNPNRSTRLFFKNLHPEVTDERIVKTFHKCGNIEKIWFVKDRQTGEFYGTAFVEMETPLAAAKVLKIRGLKIMGREVSIRIAKELRKENRAGRATQATSEEMERARPHSVFVGNLPEDVDKVLFKRDFKKMGPIVSLRFVQDKFTGAFKRCAFVGYATKAGAEAALERNGQLWMGRTLNIEMAGKK
eukprot:TRINITY_DN2512_c1_g5_i1.p1 TRINITY_DN2512_c1_g5~~TRINITY_DN2512_c1_g5_i1.p1  ORF type:complete len:364 (-),score=116.05 TRINITY_DN2512_c1_g5_i1:943-2007(-)